MKILILANNSGGLYDFRGELITALLKEHEVIASTPFDDKVAELEMLGCKLIETPIDRRGMNPVRDLKLFWFYCSMLRQEKPDAVLTYTIKPTIYGGIACRLTRTDYLCNITGLGTAIENSGILRSTLLKLYRIALKDVSCVFFQNEKNRTFFVNNKIISSKTVLLPGSGVNPAVHCFEEYPDLEMFHDRFLFIGRIMRDKGITELLDVAKRITAEYPDVSFEIVGRADEPYYIEQIRELEHTCKLKYWGHQRDVHKFYKQCSAVILPSYHEGMANVLLEASSTGRPVLASDIPGCRETFDDGVTGLGFEPGNADALYAAVKKFIEIPLEEKKNMGLAARQKAVRCFDRSIVIQKYLKELQQLEGK